jgi:hypothetical protein
MSGLKSFNSIIWWFICSWWVTDLSMFVCKFFRSYWTYVFLFVFQRPIGFKAHMFMHCMINMASLRVRLGFSLWLVLVPVCYLEQLSDHWQIVCKILVLIFGAMNWLISFFLFFFLLKGPKEELYPVWIALWGFVFNETFRQLSCSFVWEVVGWHGHFDSLFRFWVLVSFRTS